MSLRPYEGNAVLELNPSLVFPIIEILLGGSGKQSPKLNREVTEIELKLLESLFRIILQDLQGAWRSVANIAFAIESIETETQALRILAPQEAVVAIGIEIRIGETSGMMNLAIPSIVVKMMRQKFDRHWSIRKLDSDPLRRAQILQRIRHSPLCVDAVLTGASLSVRELASLEVGDVVALPQPVRTPITLRVNGVPKYQGRLIGIDGKRAVVIASLISEVEGT
jgi:flagellar motor switch protein FliM